MGLFDVVGDVVGGVAHAVEGAAEGAAHVAEGVVGEAAKIGGGIVSEVVHNPLSLLNPFEVVSGAAKNLIGDAAHAASDLSGFATPHLIGALDPNKLHDAITSAALGGAGGVYDKLFAILGQLQGKLNGVVDQMGGLDPTKDAAALNQLVFQAQEIQGQIQQLTTAATNMLKTQDDTRMAEIHNFA